MENKKIELVIEFFRKRAQSKLTEDGPTMSAGTGGFSSKAAAEGPVAGYDPVMKKKKKKHIYLGPNSRNRWMKKDV